MTINKDTG
jgi:hypothetical protein